MFHHQLLQGLDRGVRRDTESPAAHVGLDRHVAQTVVQSAIDLLAGDEADDLAIFDDGKPFVTEAAHFPRGFFHRYLGWDGSHSAAGHDFTHGNAGPDVFF